MNPTGNITALVESSTEVSRQPFIAGLIMQQHPEVEQVGFVEFGEPFPERGGSVQVKLRMAGGEFCGNASMCAAALYLSRKGEKADAAMSEESSADAGAEATAEATAGDGWQQVRLKVSGTSDLINVRLRPIAAKGSDYAFEAGVRMPRARRIERRMFTDQGLQGELPVVYMEGISHSIIEPDSVFYCYREERSAAERAVQKWCKELGVDGLGLMFLESQQLTPLVYVPGSGTSFWENSCASGSAATGMFLADRTGRRQEISLQEPGGVLKTMSDPGYGETWLYGTVRWQDGAMRKKVNRQKQI